jgi:ferrochelatase
MSRQAVLLMAYGTPERLEDVEPYYTHIRRGNPPSPELLAELIERYRAIGGPTPLNRITRQQALALEAELARRGHALPVVVGFKHVAPFVADAVQELARAGVDRAIGLVLAPHFSLRSVKEYQAYAESARPEGMAIDVIPSWHDHPALVDALAARLARSIDGAADPLVVFTAHSIPVRAITTEDAPTHLEGAPPPTGAPDDPYPRQLEETARLVAARAGVSRWRVAYQSAGRTAEPWIGPDVKEVIEAAADEGERMVVVHPIGFVADHLEILYDVDLEARSVANRRGLVFARPAMPNADPDFITVLAEVVEARLEEAG